MELTALQELIHQMYIAYYQRPADPEGLAYWVDQIEQNGSWEAVSAAFGAPENTEYQALYGDKTRAELVAELYQSAFNRAAVQDEIDFWVASEHTDLNLAFAIINGAQNDDLATVNNKVAFSAELASQLATNDAYLGLNDPKALLADITKDSTVDTDSVAAAIEADTAEPAFTLTKGLTDLEDANTALSDFLEGIDRDEDGNADYATVAALDAAVDTAESNVANDATVGVGASYIDASAAVKAQLIAAQQTVLDNALALDQIELDEAQAAVDAVAGLAGAIAALEAATAAVEDATDAVTAADKAESVAEAAAEAALAADAAVSTAGTSTGVVSVVTAGSGTGDLQVSATYTLTKVDSESKLVSLLDPAKEVVTGSAVLTDADEIAAVKALQEELADYIVAYNASVAADNALTAANEDETYAQAVVDHLDISEAAATELAKVGAGFTLTTPADEDLPTYDEVQDEITALITDAAAKVATYFGAEDDLNGTNGAVTALNASGGAYASNNLVAVIDSTTKEITGYKDSQTTPADIIVTNSTTGELELAVTATDALNNLLELADAYNTALLAAEDAYQAAYDFASADTAAAEASGEDLYDADQDATLAAIVDKTVTGLYDAFETADSANTLTDALDTANLAILNDQGTEDTSDDTGSQANLDAFAELLAEEAELLELQAQADELEAAIEAASDAFGENGFGTPVEMDTAKSYYGTSGDDLFVVDAEAASTVRSFSAQGEDVLYLGSAFTYNDATLAATTDEEAGEYTFKDAGDQSVLEVFAAEVSGNVEFYFEAETYSSETQTGATAGTGMTTVTLVGVTLDELSIVDGVVTLL